MKTTKQAIKEAKGFRNKFILDVVYRDSKTVSELMHFLDDVIYIDRNIDKSSDKIGTDIECRLSSMREKSLFCKGIAKEFVTTETAILDLFNKSEYRCKFAFVDNMLKTKSKGALLSLDAIREVDPSEGKYYDSFLKTISELSLELALKIPDNVSDKSFLLSKDQMDTIFNNVYLEGINPLIINEEIISCFRNFNFCENLVVAIVENSIYGMDKETKKPIFLFTGEGLDLKESTEVFSKIINDYFPDALIISEKNHMGLAVATEVQCSRKKGKLVLHTYNRIRKEAGNFFEGKEFLNNKNIPLQVYDIIKNIKINNFGKLENDEPLFRAFILSNKCVDLKENSGEMQK